LRLTAAFLPTLLAGVVGCGSSSDESPGAPPAPVDPTAQWPTLISADWTVPAGTEGYVCARVTVQEDLFVAGFAAGDSRGSHHALLTIGVPDAPDGVTACSFDSVFPVTAFTAAAKNEPLVFPPGVATKIPKGVQLLLNVHLSNPDQDEISGTTGIRFLAIPESEMVERADHFAVAAQRLELPARATTTTTGYCTMTSDVTLVAVAPHMHMLGKHEKVFSEAAAGEIALFDAPFAFGEQVYRVLDPVTVAKGERLRVECTHDNTTDALVANGPRSDNEMCMATFYKFPIGGSTFCADTD
jgi:hypothetical protein